MQIQTLSKQSITVTHTQLCIFFLSSSYSFTYKYSLRYNIERERVEQGNDEERQSLR